MNGGVLANVGASMAKAADIFREAEEYKAYLDELYRDVEQLRDSWKGAAAEQYLNVINEKRAKMDMITKNIEEFSTIIKKAAQMFQQVDENLSGGIR